MSWTSSSVAGRIVGVVVSSGTSGNLDEPLLDRLEPRVRAQLAADLARRAAIELDHVGGEVEGAADQRGADAVGVDRGADRLEAFDLLRVESAGDDDLHPLVAGRVEAVADRLGELRGDAVQLVGVRSIGERD